MALEKAADGKNDKTEKNYQCYVHRTWDGTLSCFVSRLPFVTDNS